MTRAKRLEFVWVDGTAGKDRAGRGRGRAPANRKTVPAVMVALMALAACAESSSSGPTVAAPNDTYASKGRYKVGKPYQIKGVWYAPMVDENYDRVGIASWYGADFHGKETANGDIYNMHDLTAAHPTLPMPSVVRVTNLENGRELKLRVNDRGPFYNDRIIDVSRRGAQLLGFEGKGTAPVRVQILAEESRVVAEAANRGPLPPSLGSPVVATARPATIDTRVAPDGPPPTVTVAPLATPVEVPPTPVTEVADIAPARMEPGAPGETVTYDPSVGEPGLENVVPPTRSRATARTATPSAPRSAAFASGRAFAAAPSGSGDGRLYVQAAAFSQKRNAERARVELQSIGPVNISSTDAEGAGLFRVRIGPVRTETEADRLLGQAVRAGYSSSRIVFD